MTTPVPAPAEVSARARWIDRATGRASACDVDEIDERLKRDDGWVWLDVPELDDAVIGMLIDDFGLHPQAVNDAIVRNHVSRLHHYRDHWFLVLHRALPGADSHVHYLELDQFIGRNFLITVHGPRNPDVAASEMLTETGPVASRLDAGRLTPRSPLALSYAIVSALTNSSERVVNGLGQTVADLEERVMTHQDERRPLEFLDELFSVRHVLLTMRTMATQSGEIYLRAVHLHHQAPAEDIALLEDLRDMFQRLSRITDAQIDYVHGITDFYRARTDTKMTVAAERLAVIAAITLPITAISGVMGMNVIVNDSTHWVSLAVLLAGMLAMSLWLLRWARRQGWW